MSERPDRRSWQRINELFHDALGQPSSGRQEFVRRACGDDVATATEVLALLEAHGRAEEFLEQPAGLTGEPERDAGHGVAPVLGAGQQVGHYRIERVLGEGGMGVVYLAEDAVLGRHVALKALSPRVTRDPDRRDRLRREARAAAALMHPGIATVFALEEIAGQTFIAGEYVAGVPLREEMARGPGAAALVLDTAVELAEALAAAHDRGVIHRDLKPENIMRTPGGRVKILDFGLARLRGLPSELAHLTGDGLVLGTPAYMAPEQIRAGAVDARADLFALGIVMAEMLTGSHPFAGRDSASTIARILESPPVALGSTPAAASEPTLREALEQVIAVCLRKAPDARFASAHELLAALRRVRDGRSMPPVVFAPDTSRALRWWKFHQAAASVSYLVLLWPIWMARGWIGGRPGLLLLLVAVVAAAAAVVLRAHLWFTAEMLPREWREQRARSLPWTRVADGLMVAVLTIAGMTAPDDRWGLAVLLVGAAVAVLVSFTVIEPATTRAAFPESGRA